MQTSLPRSTHRLLLAIVAIMLAATLPARAQEGVSFIPGELEGYARNRPTSLQFGPDGRLYVATQEGFIEALTVERLGAGDYQIIDTETISLVRNIQNHNDDGSLHNTFRRQITGLLVAGTPKNPVLYVSSSDYRIGGNSGATDTNLDTNSGIISRLTRSAGGVWSKIDLVRGLPRSEENHSPNGMILDTASNTLLLAQGGNTNAGAPSNNFAFLGETALSAAILSIDLDTIEAMPPQGSGNGAWVYDLPTVDDPERDNLADGTDPGDPFGGNDGLNQARLVADGPVQVYAPGFRNPYDLVQMSNGRIYAIDNGANQGWGGTPAYGDPSDPGTATNEYRSNEPGSTSADSNGEQVTNKDSLHFLSGPGYYGGHPNPIRANPTGAGWYTFGSSGAWRTTTDPLAEFPLPADWPPVPPEMANPLEGDFQSANNPAALLEWNDSTNGIDEYTASNFGGAMTGNLLTVSFNNRLERIVLDESGGTALQRLTVASNFGQIPLDVTAQGDDDPFPGTIWVASYGENTIFVFEPADYEGETGLPCVGYDDPAMDEDNDGYSNADEIAAGSSPCNPAEVPADLDGDFLSDLSDPDDDGDGIPDALDAFARDFHNGAREYLPLELELLNGEPGYGFGGVGFTGWMIDYETDYLHLYDPDQLIVGGTAGLFTVSDIDHGDAWLAQNDQRNAFQFGLNVDAQSGPFYIVVRLNATNLFEPNPQDYQSAGFYIGNGDQDHYLRLSAVPNAGVGGIEVFYENAGEEIFREVVAAPAILSASEHIDLYLSIDPSTGGVQPSFAVDGGSAQATTPLTLGAPILDLLRQEPGGGDSNALAVGLIATSNPRERGATEAETAFTAVWDFIYALRHDQPLGEQWETLATTGPADVRHENSVAAADGAIFLLGGRGIRPAQRLDLETLAWTSGANSPRELHHFQAVVDSGLVYLIGAFSGAYPTETPVERIYLYDPLADHWFAGPLIPEERRRGSASAARLDGKIYIAGGNTYGHGQGAETTVPWLDVFDPVTNAWTTLPDAPRARDHAQLVAAGGRLYHVGGRLGGQAGDFFSATVAEVDVYDPDTNTWTTLAAGSNLPTPRGGVAAARLGPLVVVAGGESGRPDAHDQVEAYHTDDGVWQSLPPLIEGRHGTGMVSIGEALYIVAGSSTQGASPLSSTERLSLSDDPVLPLEAIVSGDLVTSVEAIDFGPREPGGSITESIQVSNQGGNQAILIQSIALTGHSDFSLSATYAMPFVLAPEFALEPAITFTPSGTGSRSATLTVTYRNGESLQIPVGGTVEGGDPVATLASDLAELEFGPAAVGAAEARSVVLSNTGNSALTLTGAALTGGGAESFSHPPIAGAELDPGEAMDLTVTFSPVETGTQTATLAISHDGDNGPVSISLAGEGEAASGGALLVEPSRLDFGVRLPGSTTGQTISLSNIGTAELSFGWAEITGDGSAAFAHDLAAGTALAPGESVEISIAFAPDEIGTFDASLDFAHDGTNSPGSIPLAGIAGSPAPDAEAIVRINSGAASPYTDGDGNAWSQDRDHRGGWTNYAPELAIAGTGDPEIYRSDRTATAYQIALETGVYDVHLHFAEISLSQPGQRVFSVLMEGATVLSDYDIVAAVGPATADVRVIENVRVTDGTLNIAAQASSGSPKFSAIAIFEASDVPVGAVLASNPASLDLGTVVLGQSATQSLVLTNVGDTSLTIDSTDLGGSPVFSVPSLGGTELAAGASTSVPVSFTPDSVGGHDASLAIHYEGVSSPLVVDLTAAGESDVPSPPRLTSDPEDLNFGPQPVDSASFTSVTLTNTGDSVLTIDSGSLSGEGAGAFQIPDLAGLELAPDASAEVEIVFAPTAAESYLASFSIAHDGQNSPFAIVLRGDGISANAPPAPSEAVVRINSGGVDYTDSVGNFWGRDRHYRGGWTNYAADPAIGGTTDPELYRSDRTATSYQVPLAAGVYDVHLHFADFSSSQPGQRVFSVLLEGAEVLSDYDIVAAVGPAIADVRIIQDVSVTDGALNITTQSSSGSPKFSAIAVFEAAEEEEPVGPVLAGNPTSLSFGAVTVGETSTQALVLSNTGDTPLTIAGTNIAGGAAFALPPLVGMEIAMGASISVEVTFAPGTAGNHSAAVEISYDGENSPLSIALSGSGEAEPVDPGALTTDPVALEFGPQTIGSATVATVTLTNTGGSLLTVASAALSGGGAPAFDAPELAGLELAAGASADVEVTFTPAAAEVYSATLDIAHDGENSPLSIDLSGSGESSTPPPVPAVAVSRINAGGTAYTDSAGNAWSGDSHYRGGWQNYASGLAIGGTADPELYRSDRTSGSYQIPVPAGNYDVHLHFAEISLSQPGQRVFSVSIEGTEVLADYDIVGEVGPATAAVRIIEDVSVVDGALNIGANSSSGSPKFSAIAVFEAVPDETPSGAHLEADPDTLDFGTLISGETVTLPVDLRNPGDAPLTVSSATFAGSPTFTAPSLAGLELAAGASTSVELTFQPTDAGTYTGTWEIAHDGEDSPLTLSLSGEARAPEPAALSAVPAELPFGTQLVGQSAVDVVILTNTGDSSLLLGEASLTGSGAAAFAVGDLTGLELAAQESLEVEISFTPGSTGDHAAQLQIPHDGANGTLVIPLSGTGTEVGPPPAPAAALTRINAGGPAYTDSAGQTWSRDSHFRGGWQNYAAGLAIGGTADPELYRSDRTSGAYQIPVPVGTYEVHLHFAEISLSQPGQRVFSVSIEGSEVLSSYDIVADVGAATAAVRIIEEVNVVDGVLNISASASAGSPKLSAIAVFETPE